MYAVFKANGKQYKVAPGDTLKLDRLPGEAGSVVSFGSVLLLNDGNAINVGTPMVANAEVTAEILSHEKDDKIIIFKKKRRHNYRRRNGHRQPISYVKITSIGLAGAMNSTVAEKKPAVKRAPRKKADAADAATTEA
ncbi:MAG: 50S ribosomal protein L21 [Holosporales bacterium]